MESFLLLFAGIVACVFWPITIVLIVLISIQDTNQKNHQINRKSIEWESEVKESINVNEAGPILTKYREVGSIRWLGYIKINGRTFPSEVYRNDTLCPKCGARYLQPIHYGPCLLYTSPSPRDATLSRMPSSA